MKSLLPLIVFVLVVVALFAFSARARRRQAAVAAERASQIRVGTEVMTTSGLYGTVVARNDDETVQLSIAPGVEVKWAVPALREVTSLPADYRREPSGSDVEGGTERAS
jgi:preprotein translocase subunit YajC